MMKMIMTKNKRQRGFTLLEMLVAVTLLAVGLLAAAGMQSIAINSNSIANRLSVNTAIAQEVMEALLARKTDDAVLNTATPPNSTPPGWTDLNVLGAGAVHATYSVTLNTPVTGTSKIDVTVTVTTLGVMRQVSLTSYKRVI